MNSNSYHERQVNTTVIDPCEGKAPTVDQIVNALHQNLLEMNDVICSISKYIFASENDGALPSTGTNDSLYGMLLFDNQLSMNLVEFLKAIREKLG